MSKRRLFLRQFLTAFLLLIALAVPLGAAEEHAAEAEHAEGEHEQSWVQVAGQWVNFAALATLLYLFLTRSLRIPESFRAQADEIQKSIESARLAKEEAEQRMRELDQKMGMLSTEVEKIKEHATREAELEKERILESAQKEAQRLVEQAHREIDAEVRIARKELRKQVAQLAVTQGQKIIQEEMNEQDHKRLIDRYIEEFKK